MPAAQPAADRLWRNARVATLRAGAPGLGLVERGALACRDGRILYAGAEADLPPAMREARDTVDCAGRLITPGLVDCHTHLVHAGHRAAEFELRLRGASYEEIARSGGGIVSTMKATRVASEATLLAETLPRLDALIAGGVTTVEVKSGYGLDVANELKQLRVARALGGVRDVRVVTSLLAAHAMPPEAGADKDAYIDRVCRETIPAVARDNLADAVDAFCEGFAFSPAQCARVFDAAKAHGLRVKLHADQFSDLGGAALAARHDALSAEHLEQASEAGIEAMARAGTVAVMLPGAFYFIRDTHVPPIGLFRKHGVAMAVATDCNPGSSPLTSLLLAMNMAATLFRMNVDECVAGVTREAARALGLGSEIGTLEAGKSCDLAIWDVGTPAELVYRIGFNPLHARVWKGQ